MERKAIITGVAHWVPEDVLTNHDLEQMVDTSDEWIRTRTGIRERRILKDKDKATAYMGAQAAKKLLEERGMSPEEIELIVVSTVTPDMMFPNTASLIQEMIGAKNAWGFDLNAACSGFLYGLSLAEALKDDVLIVYEAEGVPLSREHGGPVRMITPQLYAWKGAKWISAIEFMNSDRPGFWEQNGYSMTANPWRDDRYS